MYVTVVASIDGRPVSGLAMRVGDVALKNSDSISLPLGEVVVHVGAGNYEGVYTCEITPDSKVCDIALAKAPKKQRRPSKRRPKIDDGEEDMINFREDRP